MQTSINIQKNDIVRVQIHDLDDQGRGVGRTGDMACFVAGALPQEEVQAKIVHVAKNYAVAELTEIIQPSPRRVSPPCPVYEACGGCQLLHLSYSAQLEHKTQHVYETLRRIGGQDLFVPTVLGMDDPWRYRNKAQFPIGGSVDAPHIGFYAPQSHRIVDVADCMIQHGDCAGVAAALREWMQDFQVQPYDEVLGTGVLRHVLIRSNGKGQKIVLIVTFGNQLPYEKQLCQKLMALPGVIGVAQNMNNRRDNVILGTQVRTLCGEQTLEEEISGLVFEVSPLSFLQVNLPQAQRLYDIAVDYALQGNTDATVLDAYCGIGTMTLCLAKRAKRAYGVEILPQAIDDAKGNALRNGIENVIFEAGDAPKVVRQWGKQGVRFDVAVIDPPRKGCDAMMLQTLADQGVPRIVYVSCNPATLARDMAILSRHGYQARQIQCVDLFPHTTHVESVVLMSRNN